VDGSECWADISIGAMKKPGCLGSIGDYDTQLSRDFDKPIEGSLLTNQYNGKYQMVFLRGSFDF